MAVEKLIKLSDISATKISPAANIIGNDFAGLGLLDPPLTKDGIFALLRLQPLVVEKGKGGGARYYLRSGLLSYLIAKRILGSGCIVPVLDLSNHRAVAVIDEAESIASLGILMAMFARSEMQVLHVSFKRLEREQREKLTGYRSIENLSKALMISSKRLEKIPAANSQLSLIDGVLDD